MPDTRPGDRSDDATGGTAEEADEVVEPAPRDTERNRQRQLVRDEKADLSALLAELTPEQWEQPSLCRGWRVRDVVAHLVGNHEAGIGAYLAALMSVERFNARQVQRRRSLSVDELRAAFERIGPEITGASRWLPPVTTLSDVVIHHQDIRRPLGLVRRVPDERLVPVLDSLVRSNAFLPVRRRAAGLALRAADLDWTHGEGAEVSGPGEALLMALAGRSAALADLTGAGVAQLSARLG